MGNISQPGYYLYIFAYNYQIVQIGQVMISKEERIKSSIAVTKLYKLVILSFYLISPKCKI